MVFSVLKSWKKVRQVSVSYSILLHLLCEKWNFEYLYIVSWLCDFSLTPFLHSIIFFFNTMSYSSCLEILELWKLHEAQGIWMLSYAWPRSWNNEKKGILSKRLQIVEWNRMEWSRIVQLEGTYSDCVVQLPDHFMTDQKSSCRFWLCRSHCRKTRINICFGLSSCWKPTRCNVKNPNTSLLPQNVNSFGVVILTIFAHQCKTSEKISVCSASFAYSNNFSICS